jgi:ZIP family zinc transporter
MRGWPQVPGRPGGNDWGYETVMSFPLTILLGAIAGFTIFLGLPIARLKNASPAWQAFLNAVATGVLVFLLWDVLTGASEPVEAALAEAQAGQPAHFFLLLFLFVAGLAVGLMSLVYFETGYIRRVAAAQQGEATPAQLSLMIAAGIGLHNFSEGLAIGQASRSGAISLAALLIIGFGLHNATEGFGIAAPLTAGPRPSWRFLALAGLIGGGPTFLGTVLGYSVQSEPVFVLCLALAAGSIFYVIAELLHVGRRFKLRELTMWGLLLGFLAGYATDLLLVYTGA